MRVKDISIKWQLLTICVLLVAISVAVLGITSYKAVESATNEQIEENLKQQALQLEMIVESVVDSVRTYEVMVEAQARGMILAQGDAVYAFITQFLGSESALFNAMGNVLVGETGYIYILDYDGNMLYHPVNPALVGTNMMNTEDANGLLFIAEQVRSGKGVSGKNLAFSTYSWLNPGETEPRDKVAGVLNIPSKQWLVVISTYYDELVDTEYENREKENLLNAFNNIVIGDTGYPFVLDSEGHYLLSANRQRDGEKIWDAKDPNGNFFIQEMIGKAKNTNVGEAAIHYYPWQNQGENRPRDKIAGLVYVEEWDWIIGPSTYLEEFQEGMLAVRNITIIVCLISIIVGSLIAYLFALYMARKFNVLMSDMKKVAEGDLTLHLVDDDGKNELSSINSSFKNMVENLKELVRAIVDNATISATSAEELSASAQEVNASSEQVSSTIQEIAKGGQNLTKTASGVKVDIEEVGKAAKLVEEKSKKAAEGAAEADKAADSGVQAGSKAKDFMAKILVSSKESAEDVSQLDAKSKEISKIIEVINGISEQTNLLALNAAIEAARAGDAGRGFAVVADEVRKLAEESQNATTQIEDMIKSIQEGTSKSVMKMTESTTLVTEGSGVVGEALKSLEEIGRLAKDIGAQAQEVSAAATQANGGVEKVSKAVGEVSAIAEESAAGTEEVSASMEETTSSMTQVSSAAQELAKGADQLKQIVSRFRLDSSNQTHAESKKSAEPKKVVESAKIKT